MAGGLTSRPHDPTLMSIIADSTSKQSPNVVPVVTSPSIDFEAGRFFERADTSGMLDGAEFQRLWRAARTGEAMQPPAMRPEGGSGLTSGVANYPLPADRVAAPPPSDLPLPGDFGAGGRFERFDRCAQHAASHPEMYTLPH